VLQIVRSCRSIGLRGDEIFARLSILILRPIHFHWRAVSGLPPVFGDGQRFLGDTRVFCRDLDARIRTV
jgi:hypothetical protein